MFKIFNYLRPYIMVELLKSSMHRVPTYEEIIYDTVLNPTDKIALPNRRASQLRSLPQLTRFDEVDETPDLAAEQDKTTKERIKEQTFRGMGLGSNETLSVARAESSKGRYSDVTSDDYDSVPGEPPPGAPPTRPKGLPRNIKRQRGLFGQIYAQTIGMGYHIDDAEWVTQELRMEEAGRRARGERGTEQRHFHPTPPSLEDTMKEEYQQHQVVLRELRLERERKRERIANNSRDDLSRPASEVDNVGWGWWGAGGKQGDDDDEPHPNAQSSSAERCDVGDTTGRHRPRLPIEGGHSPTSPAPSSRAPSSRAPPSSHPSTTFSRGPVQDGYRPASQAGSAAPSSIYYPSPHAIAPTEAATSRSNSVRSAAPRSQVYSSRAGSVASIASSRRSTGYRYRTP
jgi:hypothetical protein